MLGANSSWANPLVVQVNAPLQDDINHLITTNINTPDLNASSLPSLKHLVLTFPFALEHDTIMGDLVQVVDILHAEIDTLVHSAHIAKVWVMWSLEVSLHVLAITVDLLASE